MTTFTKVVPKVVYFDTLFTKVYSLAISIQIHFN